VYVADETGLLAIVDETGGVEVLPRVPVHETGRKTTLLLRGSLSMSLGEVPVLSTSPNMAKSHNVSKSV
jgi:hypothetical protein